MKYNEFLKSKTQESISSGFEVKELNNKLYDFQEDIVRWALRKGRSAIFADCGLGKTPMQLEWAYRVSEKTKRPVLIFAPLAVSKQTIREGNKFNIHVEQLKSDVFGRGIFISNYEQLHNINLDQFSGIVLDESSILKSYSGKFRNEIIEQSKSIKYKLCCTATPAPNDFMELGNHSEFLGSMKRAEMLAMFFIHDSADTAKWRLKGHAENKYWKWVSTWAVVIRKPSDLGYDDKKFKLPELRYHEHILKSKTIQSDMLFPMKANTLSERRTARKNSIDDRVMFTADLVNKDNDQWLVWCNLNNESKMLKDNINNSVEVKGADSDTHKEKSMLGFQSKDISNLVTKPILAGWGMNWQNCNNMAFVGLSDSYEQFYQATRRCWRFGQKKPVDVHIVITEEEGNVLSNIRNKERKAELMYNEMINNMKENMEKELHGNKKQREKYMTKKKKEKNWTAIHGDCIEEIKKIEDSSIGYTLYSPPFAELYTYSDNTRDMGNAKNYKEFFIHFKYLAEHLHRIMQDGRLMSFHCVDIPAMKERDGYIGLKDFPSDLIKAFQEVGFIFHSKHIIWKDPLIEATRTKALGLMHKQLMKDSSICRAGLPDYLVTMRKKGINKNPINHADGLCGLEYFGKDCPTVTGIKYSHLTWQKYASPVWMDIRQTHTLNRMKARGEKDEKHICPLQLDTIGRALTLWSKENDTVFSPFMGIGSEGYQAIKMGRKFIGIELKESYYNQAVKNLEIAEHKAKEDKLF